LIDIIQLDGFHVDSLLIAAKVTAK